MEASLMLKRNRFIGKLLFSIMISTLYFPLDIRITNSQEPKGNDLFLAQFSEPDSTSLILKKEDSRSDKKDINVNIHNLIFDTYDLLLDTPILTYTIDDLVKVSQQESEILIELSADILFDFDKSTLKQSAVASLNKVATRIKEDAIGDVRIEGHTDSKGSNEYNQTLSEKRAISVRDWFVSDGGLSSVQFVTKGLGELKPVASNTTEEGADNPIGRQRNRRVEIIIKTVD
ncbi:OmpA family protein [Prochlorococcus sp. MIT 1201]|uniref:OmpA family protein n=1 Tax=Prochlorococcus sp. MIT 1201 TaxID=3082535 RepID=UPI0039A51FAB